MAEKIGILKNSLLKIFDTNFKIRITRTLG